MTGQQRWRRVLALAVSQIIVMAAIVEVAPFAVDNAAAAAPAPTAVTTARAVSPIAPEAQAVVAVSVWNGGGTDLAAPVTLSMPDLPGFLSLVRADTTLVGGQWKCTPASATCQLVGSDGSTAVPLAAGEAASTRVVLAASDAAMPETLDVSFTVTAGRSSPAADLADATSTVSLTRLADDQPGSLTVVAPSAGLIAGSPSSTELTITNLGPATVGGSGETVVVAGALPDGSTEWKGAGSGWTCAEKSDLPVCTWTGTTRDVGAALDPLTLEFIAPADATAEGKELTWTRTVTATTAAGDITQSDSVAFPVLKDTPPDATVFAFPKAQASVESGHPIDIEVGVQGSGFVDPGRTITISTTLPVGWTLDKNAAPDDDQLDWQCAADGQTVSCERSADFGGASTSSTVLTLATSDATASGSQVLTFSSVVSGPDAADPTTADVTVEVSSIGAPVANVRRWSYPATGLPAQVVDGTPIAASAGTATIFGVDVQDVGSAAIVAGTELTLTIDVPIGSRVATLPDPKRAWACATNAESDAVRVTCTVTPTKSVALSEATDRVKLSVVLPEGSTSGPSMWPVAVAATLDDTAVESLATATSLPVVVADVLAEAPVLSLATELTRLPRDGGRDGELTITPANAGNADMAAGWSVSVALPVELSDEQQGALPSTCAYDDGTSGDDSSDSGVSVECVSSDSLAVGATGTPLTIPVPAPGGKATFDVAVSGLAAQAPAVDMPVSVTVLPKLAASAVASPGNVVTPPNATSPVASVLLDGRASTLVQAAALWVQVPKTGEPLVALGDAAKGDAVDGETTTFTPPRVTASTTLHFQLTVTDGTDSVTTDVTVTVEPPPIQAQTPVPTTAPNGATGGVGRHKAEDDPTPTDPPTDAAPTTTGAPDTTPVSTSLETTSSNVPATTPTTVPPDTTVPSIVSTTVADAPPSATAPPTGTTVLTADTTPATTAAATTTTAAATPSVAQPTATSTTPSSTNSPAPSTTAVTTTTTPAHPTTTTDAPAPRSPTSGGPTTQTVSSGSWSWSVPPNISKNDMSAAYAAGPVRGSRVRYRDNGTYAWSGPDATPTGITVTHTWLQCTDAQDESTCGPTDFFSGQPLGSADIFIPYFTSFGLAAAVTVAGFDSTSQPVSTTKVFLLGEVQTSYDAPVNIVAPTIAGTVDLGNTLTGDMGEFSMEFSKSVQWVRCSGATTDTCADIPGETNSTYIFAAADLTAAIRFRVTANNLEGAFNARAIVFSSAKRHNVVITCGTECYTWTVQPAINRNGAGAPTPVTGMPATLVNNGTYNWNDPSSAPSQVVPTVDWYTCLVSSPTTCVQIGSGPSVTPSTPDVNLEARLTLTGSFAEDGSVRTGHLTVPFGTVRDRNLPPTATTPPSISVPTFGYYVGNVLTADPGVWSGTPSALRTFSWVRCDALNPTQCTPTGVTTANYTIVVADITAAPSVMRVDVTAAGYVNAGTVRSAPSGVLTDYHKDLITAPSVNVGTDGLRVGVAASATDAVWSAMPLTVTPSVITWQACTSALPSSCGGALGTGPTYTPGEFFTGYYLRVTSTIVGEAYGGSPGAPQTASSVPAGPIQQSIVPVTAATDLIGGTTTVNNGATVTVTGSGTGFGFLQYSWTQTSGPSVITSPVAGAALSFFAPATGSGTVGFTLTVTDARANTATAAITVVYGSVGVPHELCEALAAANGSGLRTLRYGSFLFSFVTASTSGHLCDNSSTATITGAYVVAFGWLTDQSADVTITSSGVVISGGFLSTSTGSPLDGSGFTVPSGASLAIPFQGDDTYEMVGTLVANAVPGFFRNLFTPWNGASRLAFGNAGGVQTISLAGLAWDGSFGEATAVAGQLPVPPSGAPSLTVSGSLSTDKSMSMTISTSNLIKISTAVIDLTGTVSRSGAGAVSFSVSGRLAAPVSLASGLVLNSASIAFDGTTFSGAGSLAISANGATTTVDASFSFRDPKNWSASLSVTGPKTWTPVQGFSMSGLTASGSISRTADGTQFYFTLGASKVTLGGSGAGVELANPTFTAFGNCATGAACSARFSISTAVTVSMFGGSLTSNVTGSLDTATGNFSITATLGSFRIIDGLSFTGAVLHVDKTASGLAVNVVANAVVLGRYVTLTINYDSRGAVVLVDFGTWLPFSGAPSMSNAWLVYSSYGGSVTVGGETVFVAPNSLQIAANSGVPTWFANLIGDRTATAKVRGTIGLSPLSMNLSLQFSFNSIQVFSVGGVTLRVNDVSFAVYADGSIFSTSLSAQGTLTIPSVGGSGPTNLPVNVTLYFDPTNFSVGGSLSLVSQSGSPAWTDAFGVSGLTVQQLSIAVGLGGGGPRLGFAGTVILPPSWNTQIGIAPGTPITLAASIGGGSSCFGIEIGAAGSTTNVVDVGGLHALTAKHASLYIAPTGCTIGTTTIAAGMSMTFDGAILGVPVRANLAISPNPLSIDASLAIGDIKLNGLTVTDTTVQVTISPTVKSLAFTAKANVFGVTADVRGSFRVVAGVSAISFSGTFASPKLGGFQLNNLTVNFDYLSSPQTLTVTSSTGVTILGSTVVVNLDFSLLNGVIQSASGTAAVNITVGDLNIVGNGSFAFSSYNFPTIDITGTASAGGRSLTTVSAKLMPGSLQFDATLNVAGTFAGAPHVSGFVAWRSNSAASLGTIVDGSGSTVSASPGDFRFSATNLGLTVSGFQLAVDVAIGRVGGTFFANMTTQFNVGLDTVSISAVLKGSFDSSGNISLSGSGRATIGGVTGINLTFLLSRQGGQLTIGASASISIPSLGTAAVSGTFTRNPSWGTLYELTGSINLSAPGYNFGSATFKAYRTAASGYPVTGMQANVAVNVPDLVSGTVNAAVYSTGYFSFDTNLQTQGKLGSALGGAYARVSFRHSSNGDTFAFSASVKDVMKIPGSFTISGNIGSDGGYDVSSSVQLGPWSGSTDFFLCTAWYSAGVSLTASIKGGGSNAFSISVGGSANASAGCGSLGVGIGANFNFKYTAPSTFSLSISLRLDFGVYTWNPTVYSA